MGTAAITGEYSAGRQEVAKVGRAVGRVEGRGIAVEMDSSSSGNSCRSNTLVCEVKEWNGNSGSNRRLLYRQTESQKWEEECEQLKEKELL